MAEGSKTIGTMNGPWAVILKIVLATYPFVIGLTLTWGVWVTQSIYAVQGNLGADGGRFTQNDGLRLRADIRDEIALLPPPDWRQRIENISSQVDRVERNQIRIMAILEGKPFVESDN